VQSLVFGLNDCLTTSSNDWWPYNSHQQASDWRLHPAGVTTCSPFEQRAIAATGRSILREQPAAIETGDQRLCNASSYHLATVTGDIDFTTGIDCENRCRRQQQQPCNCNHGDISSTLRRSAGAIYERRHVDQQKQKSYYELEAIRPAVTGDTDQVRTVSANGNSDWRKRRVMCAAFCLHRYYNLFRHLIPWPTLLTVGWYLAPVLRSHSQTFKTVS